MKNWEIIKACLEELKYINKHPFKVTESIDTVWVLSAPGTALMVPDKEKAGVYGGGKISSDRMNINYGAELVVRITALRIGKSPSEITREDIAKFGPIMFYNGEDVDTTGFNYPQNDALRELARKEEFPVPESKLVIDHIDFASTPYQIMGFAKWARDHNLTGKVAIVSIGAHSVRVGRYLELYRELLPKGLTIINTPATQENNPRLTTLLEIKKVEKYEKKGDLAKKSYFYA